MYEQFSHKLGHKQFLRYLSFIPSALSFVSKKHTFDTFRHKDLTTIIHLATMREENRTQWLMLLTKYLRYWKYHLSFDACKIFADVA
jgi:hypothetical protein